MLPRFDICQPNQAPGVQHRTKVSYCQPPSALYGCCTSWCDRPIPMDNVQANVGLNAVT